MRRRAAVAGAVIAALAALAAVAALAGGGSGDAAEPGAAAKATGTGTVARRTLAERVTVEGTIGYAGETTVLARLSGTVTALPAVGDVIHRGERLYALAGEPVLLMYGAVPAYRALAAGVPEGEDVEQLERNLAALGYEPGTVDDEFTSTTAEAVSAWQEDHGLEATGEVELGRVAFLRGPQRVTNVEATLGESLGGGAGGGGGTDLVAWEPPTGTDEEGLGEAEEAPEAKEPPGGEEAAETQPEPEPRSEPEHQQATPEAQQAPPARGEEAPQPEADSEAEAGSGTESEPASIPVLHTSSTRRVVTVDLDPDQQSIAARGQEVGVVLPGGAQVKGVVKRLTTVESSGEGIGGEETEAAVEATVAVTGKRRIPALDGAAVSVLFTQRVRRDVLSVPLTALVAVGGERFAVYVREGGARRRVIVTPGLAADGYVEVGGEGLEAGMPVETGG